MRELDVDWQALHNAFQLSVPEVQSFFSLLDGQVVKHPKSHPEVQALRAQPDKYVPISAVPSHIQYQWVDAFIRSIADESLREAMRAAVNGKGAFRRFKDILLNHPDERRRWFEFRDEQLRQRIIDWVREQGIVPQNPPHWDAEAMSTEGERAMGNGGGTVDALKRLLLDWGEKQGRSFAPEVADDLARTIEQQFRISAKHD